MDNYVYQLQSEQKDLQELYHRMSRAGLTYALINKSRMSSINVVVK
ncbi:hypothetical protein [Aneurinibacillus aneurinilyticus]|nr:hypothetical protein [Aneurinibacillus aneurinilyticus]MCI1692791.1 hypothetical protein [Aneurinibacillus aneurinilyticus]MED0668857.1 hypothetical protein [Aneurinibacillus aneurinilyticus]